MENKTNNKQEQCLRLSTLAHTWLIDLDGTVLYHNGYKMAGGDCFLPGAREFLQSLPTEDVIIFLTAREQKYRETTEKFLKKSEIRYNYIIFDLPPGERVLINDDKVSGLSMSHAVRLARDAEWAVSCVIDAEL